MAFGALSIVLLIFGGCCSNVFALEAIIKSAPSSGLLITFFQFVFTTLASYPTQASTTGAYGVRKPTVPVRNWAFMAAMFFSINMLNNWAFAFSISVPVHIILRSFGSVTTMLAGVLRGKCYSPLQISSVVLLTVGVLVSAWADSERKGKSMSVESQASTSEFTTGLGILLFAQLLSAYMGAYVEDIYAKYGANWSENLFYSHLLSLPLFLPLSLTLQQQYAKLAATTPLDFNQLSLFPKHDKLGSASPAIELVYRALETLPSGVLFLLVNALTQLACISGVNLLSAKSSAVTVTIVLNIRKLVSFIFSTILFGHQLSPKMVLGSALVFGSGALYGWETSWRLPQQRKRQAALNGSANRKKE
ncbi:UAA transporter [Acrodontium crateriforme]|uniref:UAA transporter n=1 Tax=Acrodontium crateriforme TaxID=150365 RepID=A0AAQ3R9G3_9PEZI|nr:UAA transporter [Acrodontium crateriforme]